MNESQLAAKNPTEPHERVRSDKALNEKAFTDRELPSHMAAAMDVRCQFSPKDQNRGGNLSGHDPEVELLMVPDFQGASGQGANQSTNRPKGST